MARNAAAWRDWEGHYDALVSRGAFHRDLGGKLRCRETKGKEELRVASDINVFNNPKRPEYGGTKNMPELLRAKLIANGHVPNVPRRAGGAKKVARTREDWALAMREAGRYPVPSRKGAIPGEWPVEVEGLGVIDISPRVREIRAGRTQPSDSELMVINQNGWDAFAPREGTRAYQRYQDLKANAPVLPVQGASATMDPPLPTFPMPDPSHPAAGQYPPQAATAFVAGLTHDSGFGTQPSSSSAPPPNWNQSMYGGYGQGGPSHR
ncbi:hypothetical protein ABT336_16365 [Micromonospora sp. NPDC000207]|uniref:hypothetical protein n=1 Tax=Micromonospora sp. NPDC000207 TaxID=3154246 RepID=UPI00331D8D6A